MMNPNAMAAVELGIVPGLPAVRARATHRRPNIGATVTDVTREWDSAIEVQNAPSVKIFPLNEGRDGVAVQITLRTKYAPFLTDLPFLEEVAAAMVNRMESLSRGPLKLKALRAMGHPYGRGPGGLMRGLSKGASARLRRSGGQRGSVPDLSVINRQSGKLAKEWGLVVNPTATGAVIRITNTAPYAIFLVAGTTKMAAHGPFTYVPTIMQPQIRSAWSREVSRARAMAQVVG